MISDIIYERQYYAESVIKEITQQHVDPQEVINPFIAIPTTVTPACQSKASNTSDINSKCAPSYSNVETIFATQTQATQDLQVNTDTYKRGIYNATSYDGKLAFNQDYDFVSTFVSTFIDTRENLSDLNSTISDASEPSSLPLDTGTIQSKKTTIHWTEAKLIIPVSDLRGVATLPTVTINQKPITASYPQTSMIESLSYVEAALPKEVLDQLIATTNQQDKSLLSKSFLTSTNLTDVTSSTVEQNSPPHNVDDNFYDSLNGSVGNSNEVNIMIDLPLSGISNLNTVPTGQNFNLSMRSDWSTPNFIGKALPNTKNITKEGFDASWQNQYLTVANNQYLSQCLSASNHKCIITSEPMLNNDSHSYNDDRSSNTTATVTEGVVTSGNEVTTVNRRSIQLNSFGVSFANPNDVYLQTERTMKYALLLILVSFGTFFLFEVLKSSRIHPIQYLLVGCALFVFYVLLLPLAEQIAFWQAYTVAASACVSLIGWYSYYVFGGFKRAAFFTVTLSGLYAAFFGILSTEDLNLLLGAIFCFVILACVMVMTRKLDWYKVT